MMLPEYLLQKETDRLILRRINVSDIKIWTPFFSDPQMNLFFPANDLSPEERSKNWVAKQLQRYEEATFGMMMLVDKKSNEVVGQCGLLTQVIDEKAEIEIGYHLLPQFRGQGFAIEAAAFFKRHGFENYGMDSIISLIHPNNNWSKAVALKNGMTCIKQTGYHNQKVDVYCVSRNVHFKSKNARYEGI